MRIAVWLVMAMALSVPVAGEAQSAKIQSSILNMRVGPLVVSEEKVPITKALTELGRNLHQEYVIFGVELRLEKGAEPKVRCQIEQETTLKAALEQILRQIPAYRFEVAGAHLINIYPWGAEEDTESVLNLRVQSFHVTGEKAGRIIAWPELFIKELREMITPRKPGRQRIHIFMGPVGIGPSLTLSLRDVTVRQILNAVAQASEQAPASESPLGWVYSFEPSEGVPTGGHSWKALSTVPTNWAERLRKKRDGPSQ